MYTNAEYMYYVYECMYVHIYTHTCAKFSNIAMFIVDGIAKIIC